jgi:hypothetical protein
MASLIELPRGSLYREKSGTDDREDGTDRKLIAWRDAAFSQGLGELEQSPEYSEIQTYIQLIEGSQFVPGPSWRSRFTDNKIARARIESLAYLTDIKPTIDVTTHVEEYLPTAEIIKGIIQKQWKTQRMEEALEEVLDHAMFGQAFWKIGCSYPGEFNILACGMDTVIPIQQGRDLQNSTAILYRCFRPPHFFQERWPSRSEGIEKEAETGGMLGIQSNQYSRPWSVQEYSWNSMSPSMKWHKAKQGPGATVQDEANQFPVIQLQEFWIDDWHMNESGSMVIVKDPYRTLDEHNYWYRVKPGERLYPRKRLLVFAGDRVMYDGPSPYWHGMFPFAKLRLNPVVWSSGGLSSYRDLKPLNASINTVGRGIEAMVDKAVKPITITRDGAVNATSWERFFTDKPGAKLKLTPMGNPSTDVRFIDPPNLPAYVLQFQQYLLQTFKEAAGMLDVTALQRKKQTPGGDSMEQFKDALSGPRRREIRNLEAFLEDSGRIAVPCVAQFFSRDQRLRLLGEKGLTKQDFDYKPGVMYSWAGQPEEFHRNFQVEIVSGSTHTASKDRDKQYALVLARQGAISLKELHRKLELINSEQILQELREQHQDQALTPPKPEKGQGRTAMTRGQKATGSPV